MDKDPQIATPSRVPTLSRSFQLILVATTALVITLVIGGATVIRHLLSGGQNTQAATQQPSAPGTFKPTKTQWAALNVAPVVAISFKTERITDGAIASNDDTTTQVFSPFSGRVTRIFAKLGDVVKKGVPLVAVAASEIVQGQNDLVTAVGALSTARTQLKLAQANEYRQHELYLSKAGALKDWLQSQADLNSADNGVRSTEIALGAVRTRLRILGKSDTELNAIEVSRLKKMDAEARVSAPISGTVTQRQIGLGQFITSASNGNSTPIYSISNLNTVWLVANVRENDVPLMRLGQAVEVHVQAYPGRLFKAKLTGIAPSMDPNTHRLAVRAEVENADGSLKPGMFASFSISTGANVTAPGIPQSAILYEGEDARVWVAHDDGSLVLRAIHTGRMNGDMVEITDGIHTGEKIVTSGALFIDRAAQGS